MFKHFSLLLLALAVSLPTLAIDWGVEAGADFNKVSFSKGPTNANNRTGWFLGPKLRLNLPANLSLDGALLYNQKGMSYDTEGDLEGTMKTESRALPYFVVPVNLRYTFHAVSILGIYLATGPQWNWYVGKSSRVPGCDDYSRLRRSSVGWNVGAGIELLGHLQIGFSYNIGLNAVGKFHNELDDGTYQKIDVDNNSFQVRVAFLL